MSIDIYYFSAIFSIIGVIFSFIFFILQVIYNYIKSKKSNIKIEVTKKKDPFIKSPSLQVIVTNIGQNITLDSAIIMYRSSLFHFKILPYNVDKIYSRTSSSPIRFPHTLPKETYFRVELPYDYIAYYLQQLGISVEVPIKIVFTDTTRKEYSSPKFIFDMSESKDPSNPIHVY